VVGDALPVSPGGRRRQEPGLSTIHRCGGVETKRKRLSPKVGFFQLVLLNDNLVTRLLDFGEKCNGIEISTRKVEGDWPQDIPLLPVGDEWEAVDKIIVRPKDCEAYAVIRWTDGSKIEVRAYNLTLDQAVAETAKLRAAVDSVLAIVRTGRPMWSGTFRSSQAFINAATAAVAAIRARGLYASEERVAEYFSNKLGLENCDARQIRRWAAQTPYKSWRNLIVANTL